MFTNRTVDLSLFREFGLSFWNFCSRGKDTSKLG